MKKTSNPIISIIEKIQKIQLKHDLDDHIEIAIFNRIAHFEQSNIVVGDILGWTDIASPATLHARLKRLRNKQLLIQIEATDKRLRVTRLSAKAKSYLTELTKAISSYRGAV